MIPRRGLHPVLRECIEASALQVFNGRNPLRPESWSFAVLAFAPPKCYKALMVTPQRPGSELLSVLRGHEAELRACGVEALTVFGSVARGDAAEGSDVDLAVQPGATFSAGGFDHFGKLDSLRDRLATLLGCTVDLVEVSAAKPRLRQVIEREGLRAF